MRLLRILPLLAIIACAGAFPLRAQTITLSLDDAIALALRNNRTLRQSRLDVERADDQVREAVGTALPTIDGYGTYTRSILKPVFFLPDLENPGSGKITPIEIGSNHAFDLGLRATQVLFNAAIFTGLGTAKIYQRAARAMYADTYNRTIADVRRAFAGALFTRQVLEMTRASMKNAEDNLHNVEILHAQGIVSDYDSLRARVQVDNARPGVLQAEKNVVLAENGLKLLLGVDADQSIEPQGELRYEAVDEALLSRADTLVLETNDALHALQLQTQVNDEIATIRRSESLPTLVAFGNYTFQTQNNALGKVSVADFVRSSQVGVQLNVNLFNGLQTTARVGQAEVDYLKSMTQLEQTRDALRTRVMDIRLSIEEARRRIETQSRTVEQAEQGFRIATTRYAAGTGTQLEISDADLGLLRARLNRAQAVYDYTVSRADLDEVLSLRHPDTDIP